jgi:hypothetical protein
MNNAPLLNAAISGALGGAQERWLEFSDPLVYDAFVDAVNAFANAVDAAIAPIGGGATFFDVQTVQELAAGVTSTRLLTSTNQADYVELANALAALFQQARIGVVSPVFGTGGAGAGPAPANPGDNDKVAFAAAGLLAYSSMLRVVGGDVAIQMGNVNVATTGDLRLAQNFAARAGLTNRNVFSVGANLTIGESGGTGIPTRIVGDGNVTLIANTTANPAELFLDKTGANPRMRVRMNGSTVVRAEASGGTLVFGVFGQSAARSTPTTLDEVVDALNDYGFFDSGSVSYGTAVSTGTQNVEGSSDALARADHEHQVTGIFDTVDALEFAPIADLQLVRRNFTSLEGVAFDDLIYIQGLTSGGIVDNTAVFQSAINAAVAFGGKVLLIPPGTYRTGPLTIDGGGVILQGSGIEETILVTNSNAGPMFTFTYDGAEDPIYDNGLRNMTIRPSGDTGNPVVLCTGCFQQRFQSLLFDMIDFTATEPVIHFVQTGQSVIDLTIIRYKNPGDSILFESSSEGNTVSNSELFSSGGIVFSSRENAIVNCWLSSCVTTPIHLQAGAIQSQVLGNWINNATSTYSALVEANDCIVADNRIPTGPAIRIAALVLRSRIIGNTGPGPLSSAESRPIAANAVQLPGGEVLWLVDTTAGGPATDLVTITAPIAGVTYILASTDNARDVTIKNTGNIRTAGGVDRVLGTTANRWIGISDGTNIYEVAFY